MSRRISFDEISVIQVSCSFSKSFKITPGLCSLSYVLSVAVIVLNIAIDIAAPFVSDDEHLLLICHSAVQNHRGAST